MGKHTSGAHVQTALGTPSAGVPSKSEVIKNIVSSLNNERDKLDRRTRDVTKKNAAHWLRMSV